MYSLSVHRDCPFLSYVDRGFLNGHGVCGTVMFKLKMSCFTT